MNGYKEKAENPNFKRVGKTNNITIMEPKDNPEALCEIEDMSVFKNSLKENPSIIDKLIYSSNPHLNGGTMLHYLVGWLPGDEDIAKKIKLIIKSGGNVDARNTIGMTPLHIAADSEDIELIELLLSLDAKIDSVDNQGQIPIQYAINHLNFGPLTDDLKETINFLFEAGSPLFKPSREGGGFLSMECIYSKPFIRNLIPIEKSKEYFRNNSMSKPIYLGIRRIGYDGGIRQSFSLDLIVEVIYGANSSGDWTINDLNESISFPLTRIKDIRYGERHIITEPLEIRLDTDNIALNIALKLTWRIKGNIGIPSDDKPIVYKEKTIPISNLSQFKSFDYVEEYNSYTNSPDAYIIIRVSENKGDIESW